MTLGALLRLDEVQTRVGRTGRFFAFEQLVVRPGHVDRAHGIPAGVLR